MGTWGVRLLLRLLTASLGGLACEPHPAPPLARLPSPAQVTCDGRPVALPPGMEGLLVLNISSYMGGVDLWRNGYSLPGVGVSTGSRGGGGGGGVEGRHLAQSMLDGRVEVRWKGRRLPSTLANRD